MYHIEHEHHRNHLYFYPIRIILYVLCKQLLNNCFLNIIKIEDTNVLQKDNTIKIFLLQ